MGQTITALVVCQFVMDGYTHRHTDEHNDKKTLLCHFAGVQVITIISANMP